MCEDCESLRERVEFLENLVAPMLKGKHVKAHTVYTPGGFSKGAEGTVTYVQGKIIQITTPYGEDLTRTIDQIEVL